jgi:hypothetical protein
VALLTTATSRVLLNGVAGHPIRHGRGLRQGDPLSPFLFVLAIETLAHVLEKATGHGLLHKIRGRGTILRTSLYADDAAVFVAPIKEDIQNLAHILNDFGKVTRLCTNFLKSSVVPIRCANIDLDDSHNTIWSNSCIYFCLFIYFYSKYLLNLLGAGTV